MADLSAVLRKTIDGLPRATPSMRAKVYEKARAAIARQIDTANPPLADDVVAARRHALENAIAQTEAHYNDLDAGSEAPLPQPPRDEPRLEAPRAEAPRTETPRTEAPRAEPPRAPAPSDEAPPLPPRAPAPPQTRATPRPPERERIEPSIGGERVAPLAPAGRTERPVPPVVPVGIEPRDLPDPVEAPFPTTSPAARERRDASRLHAPRIGSTEPDTGLDEGAIPAADVRAPRQPNGARRAKAKTAGGSRSPVLVGLAVILFAGAATAAYVYLDDIRSALNISGSAPVAGTETPATGNAAATTEPTAPEEEDETQTATAPAAGTSAASATPKRRFTQRLLPDGTEVDEGPAPTVANAFDEGTNVAAASPPSAETQPSAMSPMPGTATTPGETAPAAATPPAETAAVQQTPPASATAPAVAQKAVFYEERSETEAGTQRAGNVVWSVVNEPPADGQPNEPAIRAVADVPEENIKLTLTIRRNTDATLPASHVIELMFDTPADFPGGSIANVQRLALKPTEQARGEPLTGVAGKISDGFFIIALNNLPEAVSTNLGLLNREQWIDIPIAYATGRRALMSIEKGIPGDRVFKQAMDAWANKT